MFFLSKVKVGLPSVSPCLPALDRVRDYFPLSTRFIASSAHAAS